MSPLRHPFAGRFRARSRVFPAEVIRPRKRSARKERGGGRQGEEKAGRRNRIRRGMERETSRGGGGRGGEGGINRGDVITEINAALSFRWQPCSLLSREPSSTSRFFHSPSSSTPPPQSNLRSGEGGPVLNFTYP